jgi:triacylglycerol lipase
MRILPVTVALLVLSSAAWAQAPNDKQTEVFCQKIHYIEAGSGPNVILLHGLGGEWHNWGPTIPALAAGYHVLVLDQIGFGASDKPLIDYRVATLVDFLEAFCKKTGVSKATVVGNSLGGWAAMAFTLAHPERVEKLVLVDSAGYSFSPPPTREQLLTLNPSTVEGAKAVLRLIFARQSWANEASAEGLLARHMSNNDGYTIDRFIDSMLRGEDFLDGKLGGIKVPTLVVWGREDRLIPLASGERFAHDIGGAQMKVLDGCGHIPQLDCAGEFNAALLKFLGTGNAGQ